MQEVISLRSKWVVNLILVGNYLHDNLNEGTLHFQHKRKSFFDGNSWKLQSGMEFNLEVKFPNAYPKLNSNHYLQ